MPKYDIQCDRGHVTEISRRINDPNPSCPQCGESTKTIITSAPSFKLVGGGWAADNYSKRTKA